MTRQDVAMCRKLLAAVAADDRALVARIVLNLPARLYAELNEALKA